LPSKTPKELIGLYHCALRVATVGVVSSPPVNLAVAEIRKFRSKDDESPAMKVPPFNPAFFFCKPPDSYPLAQLEFEVNRVNINDLTTEQKGTHSRSPLTSIGFIFGSFQPTFWSAAEVFTSSISLPPTKGNTDVWRAIPSQM